MPYEAGISRDNPTFFLFLVDQSRSMTEKVNATDGQQEKAAGVAVSINRWLHELSVKCAKIDGVRDYYSVGVIGYGKKVGSAFSGKLAGREIVPISEIAEHPIRLVKCVRQAPDGSGGLVETEVKMPEWLDPLANGATPMCRAFSEGHRILTEWLSKHPDCFPPIVINVTDGEATDGEPSARMNGLRSLSSSDGNVMLFNVHLSANEKSRPIIFPDSADDLPDDYARTLFETASPLTQPMRAIAKEHGYPTTKGSKAFVLNADMVLLVQAIDIGTRPAGLTTGDMGPGAGGVDPGRAAAGVESESAALTTQEVPTAAGEPEDPGDGVPFDVGDTGGANAEAEEEMTVVLTAEDSGEVVDCKIKLDRSGCIVKVIPTSPLDPRTEYRLHSVPVSALQS